MKKFLNNYKTIIISFLLITTFILLNFETRKEVVHQTKTNNNENVASEVTKVKKLQEKYQNKDIVGFLTIPGTNINEPILQAGDNEYYLSHSASKKKNLIGSTYLDYRVKINEGRKNLIYSHNSSTLDVPFKELENYYSEDYFEEHKYIFLEDTVKKQKYEIFSVFVETSNWSYMKLDFTDEAWFKHLEEMKNKSWYDTNVEVESADDILILQTCSHHKKYSKYKNKYLLIVAKKV